jgi:uncharacterized protein (TIGR02284 family)
MEPSQSNTTLEIEDLAVLQDLLQMNIDSRDGFAYAAKRLSDKHSALSNQFQQYSHQRNEFLETIKELREMNHLESVDRGTLAASLHRTWMELKDELSESVNISAVISEAQRGESYIKQAYESAINSVTEPRLLAVLNQQHESIVESYYWLSGLRDQGRGSKANAT